jgi:hypothetical protein
VTEGAHEPPAFDVEDRYLAQRDTLAPDVEFRARAKRTLGCAFFVPALVACIGFGMLLGAIGGVALGSLFGKAFVGVLAVGGTFTGGITAGYVGFRGLDRWMKRTARKALQESAKRREWATTGGASSPIALRAGTRDDDQ